MKIHFSKIEQLPDGWSCTIAPNDYRKGKRLVCGDILHDTGFRGQVTGGDKSVKVLSLEGRPGEGRTYTVEGKQ